MITIDSMIFTMGVDYNNRRSLINVTKNNKGQGIIEICPDHNGHFLYLWYDEGRFPSEFDLVKDDNGLSYMRLKIVGVDEI